MLLIFFLARRVWFGVYGLIRPDFFGVLGQSPVRPDRTDMGQSRRFAPARSPRLYPRDRVFWLILCVTPYNIKVTLIAPAPVCPDISLMSVNTRAVSVDIRAVSVDTRAVSVNIRAVSINTGVMLFNLKVVSLTSGRCQSTQGLCQTT